MILDTIDACVHAGTISGLLKRMLPSYPHASSCYWGSMARCLTVLKLTVFEDQLTRCTASLEALFSLQRLELSGSPLPDTYDPQRIRPKADVKLSYPELTQLSVANIGCLEP